MTKARASSLSASDRAEEERAPGRALPLMNDQSHAGVPASISPSRADSHQRLPHFQSFQTAILPNHVCWMDPFNPKLNTTQQNHVHSGEGKRAPSFGGGLGNEARLTLQIVHFYSRSFISTHREFSLHACITSISLLSRESGEAGICGQR